MSQEHLKPSVRHEVHTESPVESRERRDHVEKLEALGKAQEHELRASAHTLRNTVEQEAVSGFEYSATELQKQPNQNAMHHHGAVTRELRAMTYKRALVRLRKRQSASDKVLSKIVHQGAVDAASETLGKTVARPSGMIGGGLFALIGTTILLFTARHYGFQFNYLVFFCLFAVGLLFGQLCEIAIRLLRRS